jgi:hypothetical protein
MTPLIELHLQNTTSSTYCKLHKTLLTGPKRRTFHLQNSIKYAKKNVSTRKLSLQPGKIADGAGKIAIGWFGKALKNTN